ncbi:MAG: hypothetical protein HYX27_02965 [Acidobacteria bacterium]|nr:hypothetical protein [Acidobacteriota bacterium]
MSGYFGRGSAIGHAGELLQGAARLRGRVEPFLVTLPYAEFLSNATVRPASHWSVEPGWRTSALRAAQLAWSHDGALEIVIESNIPVGRGCGSSTADCVAVIRAAAELSGTPTSSEAIALLAQRAELASDSTMFNDEPVAFLPRRGEILRRFEGAWPAMHVECIDLGGPPVLTKDRPVPRYAPDELDEFVHLLDHLDQAFRDHDSVAVAKVATRSAIIHQRHHPHPEFNPLRDAALDAGAYGVAIAHSGTIAAVLSQSPLGLEGGSFVHSVSRRRQP